MTKYDRMVEVNQERSRFKEETAIVVVKLFCNTFG